MTDDPQVRPGRRMPPLLAIAKYWHERPDIEAFLPRWKGLWTGLGEPFCGVCGWLAPVKPLDILPPELGGFGFPDIWRRASRWLDRAHIITRATGETGSGLDAPPNLIQLCQLCHLDMPLFDAGEEAEAMAWLANHPACDQRWQAYTDVDDEWTSGRVDMSRALVHYHQRLARLKDERGAA